MSAEELKAKGNVALQGGQIKEAIGYYTEAISKDPKNKVFFSNRSAAYMKCEDFRSALTYVNYNLMLGYKMLKAFASSCII